ncbi:hypothetical protein BaRGS_00032734, partial [Batillaria attramentaria]
PLILLQRSLFADHFHRNIDAVLTSTFFQQLCLMHFIVGALYTGRRKGSSKRDEWDVAPRSKRPQVALDTASIRVVPVK